MSANSTEVNKLIHAGAIFKQDFSHDSFVPESFKIYTFFLPDLELPPDFHLSDSVLSVVETGT
jgi:hypothetical protein